jgi:hypothetical protein
VQQRIPDRHLAKALGLWEAGIAGALAVAPFIAAATIEQAGVRTAFMLSGAALITLAATAAITVTRVSRGSADRPPIGAPLASLDVGHGAQRRLPPGRAKPPRHSGRPAAVASGLLISPVGCRRVTASCASSRGR